MFLSTRLKTNSPCFQAGNFDLQRSSNIELALKRYFKKPDEPNTRALISMLKANHIQAVCFDMDGTLVDTENANWRIITEGCKDSSVLSADDISKIPELTDRNKKDYIGTTIVGYLTKLFTEKGVEDAANKAQLIAATKMTKFQQWLAAGEIKEFANITKLVKLFKANDIKTALVTSSQKNVSQEIVQAFINLRGKFDQIVAREDCNKLKPDPRPYEIASERLNVPASNILVFEDSEPGVESAQKANTTVVALRHSQEQDSIKLKDPRIINLDLSTAA